MVQVLEELMADPADGSADKRRDGEDTDREAHDVTIEAAHLTPAVHGQTVLARTVRSSSARTAAWMTAGSTASPLLVLAT